MQTHMLQDGTGVIIRYPVIGIMYIIAKTTPSQSVPGYGPGCVWVNRTGTSGSIFYINKGTSLLTDWLNVT